MNPLRLVATLPFASPVPVARLSRELKPIAWGTPDPKLARGVCRSIERATPVITIPYIRRVDRKLREYLRTHGIHCH